MGNTLGKTNRQIPILRSVGYDAGIKILEIEFHSGLVYQYSGVPVKVHVDLMNSDAIGLYVSEKVRNRFRTKQLDKWDTPRSFRVNQALPPAHNTPEILPEREQIHQK